MTGEVFVTEYFSADMTRRAKVFADAWGHPFVEFYENDELVERTSFENCSLGCAETVAENYTDGSDEK